ncbi:MAG TPA: type IV pilus biogenesis/stability protein PilW [Solimonas sp.]|nr:type IV pilus biogenesis/stability protein PilW [Solimonas sp.]
MPRLAAALLIVLLAACAGDGGTTDLQEASRINTELGIGYVRDGRLQLAQEKLERALEQNPGNAQAHSMLAFVYQRRDDAHMAERHYRRALSINSEDSSVRNNFGVFLCGRGKTSEAEENFLAAARNRRYATPEAAWTNAGVCFRTKNPEKAEQYFREALRVNPAFPDALAEMLSLNVQRQDYLRARAFVQRYEQTGRMTAEVLWLAAQTEGALGDVLAARKYQIRLKREFPESPEAAAMLKTYTDEP